MNDPIVDDDQDTEPRSVTRFKWEAALRDSDLHPMARLAGLALATRMKGRGEGRCWPAIETIGQDMGCSRSTAARWLGELVKAGYVSRQSGGGVRNGKGITTTYVASVPPANCPTSRTVAADQPSESVEQPSGSPDRNIPQNMEEEIVRCVEATGKDRSEWEVASAEKQIEACEKYDALRRAGWSLDELLHELRRPEYAATVSGLGLLLSRLDWLKAMTPPSQRRKRLQATGTDRRVLGSVPAGPEAFGSSSTELEDW